MHPDRVADAYRFLALGSQQVPTTGILRAEALGIIITNIATGCLAEADLSLVTQLLIKELLPFHIAGIFEIQSRKMMFNNVTEVFTIRQTQVLPQVIIAQPAARMAATHSVA